MSLNVYGRKRGRVGVKQCMHSLDCFLGVFSMITCGNYFRFFIYSTFCLFLSFKIQSFSCKHKLHLFYPRLQIWQGLQFWQKFSKSLVLLNP